MTSPAFQRRVRRATRIAKPGPLLEADVHKAVVRELRKAGVRGFFHCPNEGNFPVQYRSKLAALGLSPGVPDLLFVTPPPCKNYVAAALEIKREGGRTSDAQRVWLETLAGCGWATAVEYGLEACLERLRVWGYL